VLAWHNESGDPRLWGDIGTPSGWREGLASLWRWAVHHPVAALVIVAAVAIYFVWAIKWAPRMLSKRTKRMHREPSPKKATLGGTAQVLSFEQSKGPGSGLRNNWYIIRLKVHVPGRKPYMTVIRTIPNPAQRSAVRRGITVQVGVDPHGDPKNVYIEDLHRPYI
jgi:hypothetical protein